MPNKVKDWNLHKDDPNWPYDQYGFAKDLPEDHPGRSMKALIDAMAGTEHEFQLEDNYTDEFQTALSAAEPGALGTFIVENDGQLNSLKFEVEIHFEGRRHSWVYVPQRFELRDNDEREFERFKHDLMHQFIQSFRNVIYEMCPECHGRRIQEPTFQEYLASSFRACPVCDGKGEVRRNRA